MIKKITLFYLFNFVITSSFCQIVINEYSAANLNTVIDNFNKTEDWVEFYNLGSDTVGLSNYFLSDDKSELQKWKFPITIKMMPNSFLTIWLSGRDTFSTKGIHTNFKITQTKKNAETLVLSNDNGVILDEIKINKTKQNQSRARITDGNLSWGITKTPTFNHSNNSSIYYKSFADRPSFDIKAGFFDQPLLVSITNNAPNSILKYTLDGTEPTLNSNTYSTPISIDSTTVLKAMSFSSDTNVLPSFVEFATYFIGEKHSLVVVSISADSLDILANGDNQKKPIGSIEYFNKNGERKANSYGEFNSHGQDSWVNDQRSLDFVARDECGYNKALSEKIFDLSDRTEFQRLILRAAGDDNYPATTEPEHDGDAHVRDAYVHNLVKKGGLNLDVRISEKSIVYLNGKYWGVYDLREIPDDNDYTEYYYGQGKYDIQYILTWGNTWVEYGDSLTARKEWKTLYDYILKNDMSIQSKYDTVAAQLDVASFSDYMIVNSITVCSDWLNYNTGWWRGKNPNGKHQKWGYILWDNDATFGYYINYTGIKDTSANALPCNIEKITNTFSDPMGHIKILNRLLKNQIFKQYFISRYIDLINTTFSCNNMLGYLDTIVNTIDPEMHRHIQRWGGTYDEWRQNVQRLRYFIERRCVAINNGLNSCYNLKGPYPITFDANPIGAGKLRINSLLIDTFPYTGNYFSGLNINLIPIINDTMIYKFDKFTSNNSTSFIKDSTSIKYLNIQQSDTIIANFVKLTTSYSELITPITEIVVSAYPTLFTNEINLIYDLPNETRLDIGLYDNFGHKIATLNNIKDNFIAGHYSTHLQLNDTNMSDGIYYIKFQAKDQTKIIKLVKQRN